MIYLKVANNFFLGKGVNQKAIAAIIKHIIKQDDSKSEQNEFIHAIFAVKSNVFKNTSMLYLIILNKRVICFQKNISGIEINSIYYHCIDKSLTHISAKVKQQISKDNTNLPYNLHLISSKYFYSFRLIKSELSTAYDLIEQGIKNKFKEYQEDDYENDVLLSENSIMANTSFLEGISNSIKQIKSLPVLIILLLMGTLFPLLFLNKTVGDEKKVLLNTENKEVLNIQKKANGLVYEGNPLRLFTGMNIIYWPDGQKKEQASYLNGKSHGLSSYWYKSGQIKVEEKYVQGEKHGLITTWYENGNRESKLNFIDGKQDGLSITWYENMLKKSEVNYFNGKQDGLTSTWYDNGMQKEEIYFIKGKKHGLSTLWYSSGRYKMKTYYKKGWARGTETKWYDNGEIKSKSEYGYGSSKTVHY